MATIKFMETPDALNAATNDAQRGLYNGGVGAQVTVLYDTSTILNSGLGSWKVASGTSGLVFTDASILADAGGRISGYWKFSGVPSSGVATCVSVTDPTGALVFEVALVSGSGKLRIDNGDQTAMKTGLVTCPTGATVRIAVAYVITSTTNWTIKVFLSNSAGTLLETIIATNANATLTRTGSYRAKFGPVINATIDMNWAHIYIDDGTTLDDPGDMRVTAKRPNANGSSNLFTTQIGAGGSGYGSGHAPQVNERVRSDTNGWQTPGPTASGFVLPTAETQVSGAWNNPTNIEAATDTVTDVSVAIANGTAELDAGNFGLSIPNGALISKVEVKVRGRVPSKVATANTNGRLATADANVTGTWTNLANAIVENDSVATITTTSKVTDIFELQNFGFSTAIVPDNATILKVEMTVRGSVSSGTSMAYGANARVGTTDLTDHTRTDAVLTTTTYDITAERAWVATDLRDGTLKVRFNHESNTTNSRTSSCAWVEIRVTFRCGSYGVFWKSASASSGTEKKRTDAALTTTTYDVTAERAWVDGDFADGTWKVALMADQDNCALAQSYEFAWVETQVTYFSGPLVEGYAIESASAGDVDITGATILGYRGWAQLAAVTGTTATRNLILNGSSAALTTTISSALYSAVATSATYPATAEVIGVSQTTGNGEGTSLFECGVLIAYIPGTAVTFIAPEPFVVIQQAVRRAALWFKGLLPLPPRTA